MIDLWVMLIRWRIPLLTSLGAAISSSIFHCRFPVSENVELSSNIQFVGTLRQVHMFCFKQTGGSVLSPPIHETPSDVTALDGCVVVSGPGGLAVNLSADAAEETGKRLCKSATEARDQRSVDPALPETRES